ncbi:endo-1,4-beta-xylanase [Rhodothermus marinus]|uniref:endo-1,4-beta-xylanase n=1 Tax=Rhodothermus marinus TaxID=29549 RepID=UPI0037C6C7D0
MRRISILLIGLYCALSATSYGQSWRAAAEQRIEQYRKGPLRVRVVRPDGQPVEGAQVHVRMTRHAFGFGTAISFGLVLGTGYNPTYRAKLEDLTGDGRSFNLATPENALKWPSWEGEWPVSNRRKIDIINWLRAKGYEIRGHNLLWPDWQWMPDDIEQNRDNPQYIYDRVREHIFEVAGHRDLRGKLREWDVLNEPAHLTALRDVFNGWDSYEVGEDFYVDVFQWAKQADSTARLFINEYNIINNYANEQPTRNYYKWIIARLLSKGAPLEGIGIQGHFSAPLPSMTEVKAALDEMAVFGLPLSITEYDVRGVSEQAEASFMEDFLTMVFSHPAVESFVMWGFWDGAHWRDNAPLFREDWSLKPSGEVFLELVFDRWWTDTTGVTGADGSWVMRGFLGDYVVEVDYGETSAVKEVRLMHNEDTTDVEVVLTSVGAEEDPEESWLRVEGFGPDPFVEGTVLRYWLGRPAEVMLEVYDVLGRRVYGWRGRRVAGWHAEWVEGSSWPSGLYVYRLEVDGRLHTGRILKIQ